MNNTIDVQVCGNRGMFPCTYKTVVLKPNIINDKNILNQGMMNMPNTKYVIKYDFLLSDAIVEKTANVISTNVSHCGNSAYATALAAYNLAHDAWIDADNAYTNDPNDTTLAAKNAAYAALESAQLTLNGTPQYYYFAGNAINIKKGQNIVIPEGCVLLNDTMISIVNFDVAPNDMTAYIGSATIGSYDYKIQDGIVMPANCLIEFDGGSISNGAIVGDDTYLIFNQNEEDILKNVTLLGNFIYPTANPADKKDNVNGMAKVYLKKNKSFASQVTQQNTIYVIQYDFDLGGESVTIPENCVLEFDGGSLRNGTLVGNNTYLKYNAPFLYNCVLTRTFIQESDVVDEDVYKIAYSQFKYGQSLLAIHSPNEKVIFKKKTFNSFETLTVDRNLNIDFDGSILNMELDSDGLPLSLIFTESTERTDGCIHQFIKVSNANIVGNTNYYFDTNTNEFVGGVDETDRRSCLKIFGYENVEIDNINISNYDTGDHSLPIPINAFYENWQGSLIACYYYKNLVVNGCIWHDSGREHSMLFFVPILEDNNAIISNNKSYNTIGGMMDGYDFKGDISFNSISNFDGSAINAFGYDLRIHDNNIYDSRRSCAIDIDEISRYVARNVEIYNNIISNIPNHTAIDIAGKNIIIHDNKIKDCCYGVLYRLSVYDTANKHDYSFNDYETQPIPLNNEYNHTTGKLSYEINNNLFINTSRVVYADISTTDVNYLTDIIQYKDCYITNNIIKGNKYSNITQNKRYLSTISVVFLDTLTIDGNYFTITEFSNLIPENEPTSLLYLYSAVGTKDNLVLGRLIIKNNYYNAPLRDADWLCYTPDWNGHISTNLLIDFIDNTSINKVAGIGVGSYVLPNLLKSENINVVDFDFGPYGKRPSKGYPGLMFYDTEANKPLFRMDNGTYWDANGIRGDVPYNGTSEERTSINKNTIRVGFDFFDSDLKMPCFHDGNTWRAGDSAKAGINRAGVYDNKPIYSDIYVGFRYFCTDRKVDMDTSSSTYMQIITPVSPDSGGMDIIYKGRTGGIDVWVDALGRVVS